MTTKRWIRTREVTPKPAISRKTKLSLLVEMLRRPEGATISQVAKRLSWQRHSVRGAIAGSLKRLDLQITRTAQEGGERTYRIEQ
jgi:hypothetical protein